MAFTEVGDILHSMLTIYMSTMLKHVHMNTASIGNGSVFIWCETVILPLALRTKNGSKVHSLLFFCLLLLFHVIFLPNLHHQQ